MTDFGSQIADVVRSLEVADPQQRLDLFRAILRERFPTASREDVLRAKNILEDEHRAQQEEYEASIEDAGRMVAFLEKHNVPADMPFGTAVRTLAAKGDPEAIAYLSDLNSPESLTFMALFDEAVNRHPDWERDDAGRYACLDEDGSQGTPETLVNWFQMTFPREAREVEARAISRNGVREPR